MCHYQRVSRPHCSCRDCRLGPQDKEQPHHTEFHSCQDSNSTQDHLCNHPQNKCLVLKHMDSPASIPEVVSHNLLQDSRSCTCKSTDLRAHLNKLPNFGKGCECH